MCESQLIYWIMTFMLPKSFLSDKCLEISTLSVISVRLG